MPDRTRWTENAFYERIGVIKRTDPKLFNNLSPQVRASYEVYAKQKHQAEQDEAAKAA